jgi:hypothetical protein
MTIYPPASFRHLSTTSGGVDDFPALFRQLRRRWVKVERMQEYDESGSAGYQAFKKGAYGEARRLVQDMVKSQDEIYSHARRYAISMIRVRICDLPLSPYLVHYEIPAYLADLDCGEDIRFVDSRDIGDLLVPTGISDYVLFDDKRVIVLIYAEETGRLAEARLVEDRDLVKEYVEISDQLIRRSNPMLDSPIFQSTRQV